MSFAKICFISMFLASAFAAYPTVAHGQANMQAPSSVPWPMPDFHFSDPARDAEYWRLERESDRASAIFRSAVNEARRALEQPAPGPGTPAWFQAREAVEQAILARRAARNAKLAIIEFLRRERPQLPPSEAAEALRIVSLREETLRASSDILVDLLAGLAGIKIGQWPP